MAADSGTSLTSLEVVGGEITNDLGPLGQQWQCRMTNAHKVDRDV